MKLFTSPLCPFAHRVRLVLAEKGIELFKVEVDPRNKPAELLALGPRGTVPALETHDRIITGSAVIAEFLDETYPSPALMPRNMVQRAIARMWVGFADERLYAHTRGLMYAAPESERPQLLKRIHEDLRHMESHVLDHGGPFWMGEQFTLVDLAFLPWFEQSIAIERFRGFTWPADCTKLPRWRNRVMARPAVRAIAQPPEYYERAYGALAGAQKAG